MRTHSRPNTAAFALVALAVVSFGADCGPTVSGDWVPETLVLQSDAGVVTLSLTDALPPNACASADAGATLTNARQLLVPLGSEPFEATSKVTVTVTDRTWSASAAVETSVDIAGAATVSTSSCTSGCLIELEVVVDGTAHLLLAELAAAAYPRCLNAGEFTFGPL